MDWVILLLVFGAGAILVLFILLVHYSRHLEEIKKQATKDAGPIGTDVTSVDYSSSSGDSSSWGHHSGGHHGGFDGGGGHSAGGGAGGDFGGGGHHH